MESVPLSQRLANGVQGASVSTLPSIIGSMIQSIERGTDTRQLDGASKHSAVFSAVSSLLGPTLSDMPDGSSFVDELIKSMVALGNDNVTWASGRRLGPSASTTKEASELARGIIIEAVAPLVSTSTAPTAASIVQAVQMSLYRLQNERIPQDAYALGLIRESVRSLLSDNSHLLPEERLRLMHICDDSLGSMVTELARFANTVTDFVIIGRHLCHCM